MRNTSSAPLQRFATLLAGIIKNTALYPPGHPTISQALSEAHSVLTDILRQDHEMDLGILDGTLYVKDHLFASLSSAQEELVTLLSTKTISRIRFLHGTSTNELLDLIKTLSGTENNIHILRRKLELCRIENIRIENDVINNTYDFEKHEKLKNSYNSALAAVSNMFSDAANGKVPNAERISCVVDSMVSTAIQEPATILCLAMIKDYDHYTYNHSVNVGVIAIAFGAYLGKTSLELKDIGIAGMLHDIGKTTIDKEITNKPGKLSVYEFNEMKKHPENGARIVSEMGSINPEITNAVLCHHLHFDRSGYPEWARDTPVNPLFDAITIADCYDALTTLRAYQPQLTPQEATGELRKLSDTILNRETVDTFIEFLGEYPAGSLVRLSSNEVAVVVDPGGSSETPTVKIITDPRGTPLESPRIEKIGHANSGFIVALTDPVRKSIDVSQYLK